MGNSILIRPDGSEISVDEAQAGNLRALGYKDKSTEQEAATGISAATEAYYTSPEQKIATGFEGALGGATLGLSDLAFDHLGFDTAERAGYNPGIRLGTELVGGLSGLGLSGLLGKGAKAVGGLAEGKAAQAGITAAIEGGGFGAQQAITSAVVNGDPLTVEAVMAGVGWGSVWGGGLGYMAGKIVARAEAKAAEKLAAQEAQAAVVRETSEAWGTFRGAVTDVNEQLGKMAKTMDSMVGETAAKKVTTSNIKGLVSEADQIRNSFLNELTLSGANPATKAIQPQLRSLHKAAIKELGNLKVAAKAQDFEGVEKALTAYGDHVSAIGELTGLQAPEIAGFSAQAAKDSIAGAKTLADSLAVKKEFGALATSPEAFSSMTSAKAEKLFGAVDTFLKNPAAEFKGAQEGMKAGISRLQEAVGVAIDGPPSTQLRGVWEAMKHQGTVKAAEETASALSGVIPWGKQALGYAAGRKGSELMRNMGMGGIAQTIGYEAGKRIAMGLMGVKAAVIGGVAKAANEWVPRALSKASPMLSRAEPLAVRLDGQPDLKKKSRLQLMEDRAKEIHEAAGSVRDTLFKSVAPLNVYHPEFAAGLHALGAKQFMFLMNKLPRDPGNGFNRLQTLWKPDPVAIEKFSRYYEVFQDPVGVARGALMTGHVTPEAAEGLREMNPALFQQLRVDMLERISQPGVLTKMSYSDQINLGLLLNIPIHSTLTPRFIATQQQMYAEKNPKTGISPRPGVDNGGGRPSGPADVSGATSAQKIEAH